MNTWSKIDQFKLQECLEVIQTSLKSDKSIYVVGNGGSSSTASHFVVDWTKGYNEFKPSTARVLSLSDNVPLLTATSNDIDYNKIFARPLQSWGKEDDLLVCISGSGNSKNIIEVCEVAKQKRISIVALTGFDGGKLLNLADYSFHCPIDNMQIVEDMHLSFGHMVFSCRRI